MCAVIDGDQPAGSGPALEQCRQATYLGTDAAHLDPRPFPNRQKCCPIELTMSKPCRAEERCRCRNSCNGNVDATAFADLLWTRRQKKPKVAKPSGFAPWGHAVDPAMTTKSALSLAFGLDIGRLSCTPEQCGGDSSITIGPAKSMLEDTPEEVVALIHEFESCRQKSDHRERARSTCRDCSSGDCCGSCQDLELMCRLSAEREADITVADTRACTDEDRNLIRRNCPTSGPCSDSEPDLSSANMAAIAPDSCDSTGNDEPCAHHCLQGFTDGLVRCADGQWDVRPCRSGHRRTQADAASCPFTTAETPSSLRELREIYDDYLATQSGPLVPSPRCGDLDKTDETVGDSAFVCPDGWSFDESKRDFECSSDVCLYTDCCTVHEQHAPSPPASPPVSTGASHRPPPPPTSPQPNAPPPPTQEENRSHGEAVSPSAVAVCVGAILGAVHSVV
eukprot:COSAG02_NODE_2628_length_8394_cov_3.247016_8_plen_450_part_00